MPRGRPFVLHPDDVATISGPAGGPATVFALFTPAGMERFFEDGTPEPADMEILGPPATRADPL